MRTHGTLSKWVEERGFGFITPADGGKEVFVHVSVFPKGGARPQVGELLSFEVIEGPDGKRKAAALMRPGAQPRRRPVSSPTPAPTGNSPKAWVAAVLVVALGVAAAAKLGQPQPISPPAKSADIEPFAAPGNMAEPAISETFSCDGRIHCSQMTSCEEAVYFIENCPDTRMDGDNDGHPCEGHWCRGS